MIQLDVDTWCRELIECGDLADANGPEVVAARIERYWELIDMVEGNEGQAVFNAILASIQDEGSTEAYESTFNALWRFGPDDFAAFFVEALPDFADRVGGEAGRFLLGLVGFGARHYLPQFNAALARAPREDRQRIVAFLTEQEEEGRWFSQNPGLIRPRELS